MVVTAAPESSGNVIPGQWHSRTREGRVLVWEDGKFWRALECSDGLNENGPCRLTYLNTLSPVGGAVWERLGGMALLE